MTSVQPYRIIDTPEFQMGSFVASAWSRRLIEHGKEVKSLEDVSVARIPFITLKNGKKEKAPAPDLDVWLPSYAIQQYHDAKGKTGPDWWAPKYRWEQGIDFLCIEHYKSIYESTRVPFYLIFGEFNSPVDPDHDSDLKSNADLRDGLFFLAITLLEAIRVGDHRIRWPNPYGGRGGRGGLLIPRNAMYPYSDIDWIHGEANR